MELTLGMEILATILVVVGVWYVGTPHIAGQWLMLFAQLIWLPYSVITKQYFLGLQSLILTIFAVRALKRWKEQGVGNDVAD